MRRPLKDERSSSLTTDYIRQGMQPVFPHFNLQWQGCVHEEPSSAGIKVIEGQAQDPALLQWDAQVTGPHPCLAPLLERGFQIIYVETFHSTAATPFFDARCYIPSGSDLL